jgi:hypothetical protein
VLLLRLLLMVHLVVMFRSSYRRHWFLLNGSCRDWWRHFTGHQRTTVSLCFHIDFHTTVLILILLNGNFLERRLDDGSESSQIHRKSSVHPR